MPGQRDHERAGDRRGDVTHVDEGAVLPERLPLGSGLHASLVLDPRVGLPTPYGHRAQ